MGVIEMDNEVNTFRLNYRVVNRTNQEMIVRAKGGLGYIIKRCKEPTYSEERCVFVELPNVYIENLLIDEELALTKFDRELLKGIKQEADRVKKNAGGQYLYQTFSHTLHVVIKLMESMVEKNDAIHSELLGMTLYNGLTNANQPSLNTPGFTIQELFNMTIADQPLPEGGLHHFIFCNDPRRHMGALYSNIMGKAVEVPVVSDETRLPGLYMGVMHGNESPQTLFYTFDRLDKKALEALGLFESRSDCESGGNTERAIAAEKRAHDLNKELQKSKDQIDNLDTLLERAEANCNKLNQDVLQLKQDHRTEVTQMKHRYEVEISQLKHQTKMSGDLFKYEQRIKDAAAKANLELIKHKGSVNTWGEFAKAIGTIAGLGFTGYKLFTS
jgi:hypothetical protein